MTKSEKTKMPLEISRTYTFDAAHRLPDTPSHHKCNKLHGHTWEAQVWVTGTVDSVLGWIIDYADLDRVWVESVHAVLDHSDLNEIMENPTTENIVRWIYTKLDEALERRFPGQARVTEISVREGGRGWCRLRVERATPS